MSPTLSLVPTALQTLYRPVLRRAAGQIAQGRLLDPDAPRRGRWTAADIDAFLELTWEWVDERLPRANLEEIPTWENRHNVYLAVVTTAAYRALLERGLERDYAINPVADMGMVPSRCASAPASTWLNPAGTPALQQHRSQGPVATALPRQCRRLRDVGCHRSASPSRGSHGAAPR